MQPPGFSQEGLLPSFCIWVRGREREREGGPEGIEREKSDIEKGPSFTRLQPSTFLFPLPSASPLLDRPRTLGKTLAAVATLGTGNSLGPEGPAVELGVASSRYVSSISNLSVQRQRMLLGAGAAAGVAAGFNAPIAGIFFALEIVKVGVAEGAPSQPPRSELLKNSARQRLASAAQ